MAEIAIVARGPSTSSIARKGSTLLRACRSFLKRVILPPRASAARRALIRFPTG
jgi:hypothetical protein